MDYAKLFRLDGRTALIVGGGSGIGQAASRALAAQGARVIVADLNPAGAEATARLISEAGGQAETETVDVVRDDDVRRLFDAVHTRHDTLDVVVVTPGINIRKPILSYSADDLDRVLAVNLKGTFYVLREAARLMAPRGKGSIIALASIRALTVEPGQSVYSATKAGIVLFVRTLAAELGSCGVRVNAVAPGVTETPLTRPITTDPTWYQAYADRSALGRWASADEMAGPIVFLASDAASYVTGSMLVVDGGWTAIDGRYTPVL
jgi:NAD(P)-dependent dehydrogenase (short-subunit alcohol dehydrogenase family)